MSLIRDFIRDRCVVEPAAEAENPVLLEAWNVYTNTTTSATGFGRLMTAAGFPITGRTSKGPRLRRGLRLKMRLVKRAAPEAEPEPEQVPVVDVQIGEPPPALSEAATIWWHEMNRYELEAHHLLMLSAAAEEWDRIQALEASLADTSIWTSPTYQKANGDAVARPEVSMIRAGWKTFRELVRELGIDIETPERKAGRPPRPVAARGKK